MPSFGFTSEAFPVSPLGSLTANMTSRRLQFSEDDVFCGLGDGVHSLAESLSRKHVLLVIVPKSER